MKKLIKYSVLSLVLLTCLNSCSDYFNLLPLNEIVLESYYTEENDIKSVVNSCYAGMESTSGSASMINLMAAWGEMRSDNIVAGASTSTEETQILKENILPTTKYSNWAPMYTVINRCNTVIHYAPIVNKKDPNYTESEMRSDLAEVKALRALCYFYLIRTFRDVPLVTEPSIDDNQEYAVPAARFDSIITYLVNDLEVVKDYAVRRYSNPDLNTTRITRYSIYALLADLYLWKQDYAKCIDYCDKVIAYKKELYDEELTLKGSNSDLELYKDIPLIAERRLGSNKCGNSSTKIFGTGHSFESIFELNYEENQSIGNTYVSQYYGTSSSKVGLFSAPPFLMENVATGANKIFKNTDCRPLASIEKSGTQYAILKYTRSSVSFDTPLASSTTSPGVSYSVRSTAFSNWIIYRLTDIVLMKAEAEIQLGKQQVGGSANTAAMKPYLLNAFSLVSAVYNRANVKTAASTDTLKFSDYGNNSATMEDLVMVERQRELLFEGKRWFDLVRRARREGKNDNLISNAIKKQTSNTGAIQIKLMSPDAIYFPYSETELKSNPFLNLLAADATEKTSTLNP